MKHLAHKVRLRFAAVDRESALVKVTSTKTKRSDGSAWRWRSAVNSTRKVESADNSRSCGGEFTVCNSMTLWWTGTSQEVVSCSTYVLSLARSKVSSLCSRDILKACTRKVEEELWVLEGVIPSDRLGDLEFLRVLRDCIIDVSSISSLCVGNLRWTSRSTGRYNPCWISRASCSVIHLRSGVPAKTMRCLLSQGCTATSAMICKVSIGGARNGIHVIVGEGPSGWRSWNVRSMARRMLVRGLLHSRITCNLGYSFGKAAGVGLTTLSCNKSSGSSSCLHTFRSLSSKRKSSCAGIVQSFESLEL